MAETECTQAQWEAVMGYNPSYSKGADLPVERVTWSEAVEYCRKLTTKHRAEGALPEGWEWRLPTNAEWEYAARAGTKGARPGALNAIAWYYDNSAKQTHPVKQKAGNAWGLHDVIGNVWEWCSDMGGDKSTGSVTDPKVLDLAPYRAMRGGACNSPAFQARSAQRLSSSMDTRTSVIGFRPVLSSVSPRH